MRRWTYRTALSGLALVAAFILGSCGGSTTDPGTAPGNTTGTSVVPNDGGTTGTSVVPNDGGTTGTTVPNDGGTTMETPMMDATATP